MAIETIKRKNGVRYRVSYRMNGRKAPSRTFNRKIDAEAWERRMRVLHEDNRGIEDHFDRPAAVSLDDYQRRFSLEYAALRQAPATRLLEERLYAKHVRPYLGSCMLDRLGRKRIENLFLTLRAEKQVSAKRVNRVRTLLRGMFNQAVRWELIQRNPVHGTQPFPTRRTTLGEDVGFLSQTEARQLLDWLLVNDSWLYPKVRTLLNTGLRYGEMVALQIQDVIRTNDSARLRVSRTYDKHTYTIRDRTKGNRSRMIPLGHGMATFLLGEGKSKKPNDPLLWKDWLECKHATKFNQRFWSALAQAKVHRIRVHDLRHTFAVHFLEQGGQLYDLQKLLGHSTIRLTERYSHFSQAMSERARGLVDHHAEAGNNQRALTVIDGGLRTTMSHKRPTKAVFSTEETGEVGSSNSVN